MTRRRQGRRRLATRCAAGRARLLYSAAVLSRGDVESSGDRPLAAGDTTIAAVRIQPLGSTTGAGGRIDDRAGRYATLLELQPCRTREIDEHFAVAVHHGR